MNRQRQSPPTVTSARFEALTGISPGQLQRWSEKGILYPRFDGPKKCRRFSEGDALAARIVMKVSAVGQFEAPRARQLLRQVIPEILNSEWWTSDQIEPAPMLIVLGKTRTKGVLSWNPADAIAEIAKYPGPGFLIDLREVVRPIRRCRYFRSKSVSKQFGPLAHPGPSRTLDPERGYQS